MQNPKVRTFFKSIFGTLEGYVCVATLTPDKNFEEKFYKWPEQSEQAYAFVDRVSMSHNVYFCPQLLSKPSRTKDDVKLCTAAWADLDACPPNELYLEPTWLVKTSVERFQALWIFEAVQEPELAEDLSRRIAYAHKDQGADKTGWDLTQLLRVPATMNFKYDVPLGVEVVHFNQTRYRLDDFLPYDRINVSVGEGIEMPEVTELPDIPDPVAYLHKYKETINPKIFGLMSIEPKAGEYREGWSGALWLLLCLLFEAGFSKETVYVLACGAACNKYARDGRSNEHLWDDVRRAYVHHHRDVKTVIIPELNEIEVISEEELDLVKDRETFIERYIKWAEGLGDAAVQYHQAGAFTILSALLSGKVHLPTSFGNIVPNLWFMILGDTTLTRKSTSMDIATDLLLEIDPDAIMATDGSIEGLMTGLSTRPNRPSIFLRDEFSGLMEAMTKKDYMAGMPELLTKLYDGKFSKRLLRKDPVEIRDPILIMYTGGIKSRMQQLMTLDHISSGFMPRFIFITAESDVSKVQPMGPPIVRDMTRRGKILDELTELYDYYTQVPVTPGKGIKLRTSPKDKKWNAELTPSAWERFNQYEKALMTAGLKSERADILSPVYDRLGKSTLKAAVLIAASMQRDEERVTVGKLDIIHAIRYANEWREYVVDVINGVGRDAHEREIDRIKSMIQRKPGISRSSIMQSMHLTAAKATAIFSTMEQRGLIQANTVNRLTTYRVAGDTIDKVGQS